MRRISCPATVNGSDTSARILRAREATSLSFVTSDTQEDEFVSPEARHRIVPAQAGPKALGDLDENLVARGVAEPVVDLLEVVEVQEHHGQRLPMTLRMQDRERKPVGEQEPVRKPRQDVV